MEPLPDLTYFFAIHRKMRVDTRLYATAIATSEEHDRNGRLRPLARWAKGFQHELREHHHVEDTYFFPDMRRRVPSSAAVLDVLAADHATIDRLLGRWPVVAARLVDNGVAFERAKVDALEVACELRDLLERHLDIEDRDVLPLYWRHYAAEEYDALQAHAVANGNKRGLAFFVPWNVACLDEEHKAALLATAPLPLKLVWYATRGRFERLERAAFGGIDTSDLPVAGAVRDAR
jgi:hemerythrin-like domain-containing protein